MTDGRPLGEITVLDDVGPPRRGRAYPVAGTTSALLLPAGVLLGGLVVWPVLRTLYASVTAGGRFVGGAHFRAALEQPGAWSAVGRTVIWALVVPAVVTALGYLLAAASPRSREGGPVQLILVLPIAVPLVVAGLVFRLLYDPDPGRGLATLVATRLLGRSAEQAPQFLGPELVTAALMSAFVWSWVGLAVLVFRAALDAVPQNLADAVRANGGTRRDVLWHAQWRPLLLRTAAVVFTLVALATARTFDLILVMVPGSVRDEASVLAVLVWQTSGAGTTGSGAALGVVWLAVLIAGLLLAAFFLRQNWPPPRRDEVPEADQPPVRPRRVMRILAAVAAVVWLVPLAVLVATSLHDRRGAAVHGWWASRPDLGSYAAVLRDPDLHRALAFTLLLATAVTGAVLIVALLAAYPLAWLTGPAAQLTGVLLTLSAVVPSQVIAGPVNEVLGVTSSSGTAWGLALVHISRGVPFAVLLLRNAVADLPAQQVRRARVGGRWWTMVWRLTKRNQSAVIAVCVLEFVQVWNDLVVGLLFGGQSTAPLGALLFSQTRQFVANSGPLAASSVVASVLPVVLVILARQHLITGLVAGGVPVAPRAADTGAGGGAR
ncbi:hypothetical protein [Plantactinospora sp. GCM10030261]|uniref:ABC transporter permease n=1 Tax=Plantactinospora sp. GCM10030261 TaxID=3273420 RepID=UPI00360890FE